MICYIIFLISKVIFSSPNLPNTWSWIIESCNQNGLDAVRRYQMQGHEKGAHRGTGNIDSISSRNIGKEGASLGQRLRLRTKYLFFLLLPAFLISPLFISIVHGETLTVQVSGNGTVSSSQGGISCPGACTATLSHGTPVTFSAFPNDNSIFSGWGDSCSGLGTCALTLFRNMTVSAIFSPKSSAVQVGGSYYGALQNACDNVAAGGVVMAVAQGQPGNLTIDRGIGFTLKGGYNNLFSSITGVTNVNGTVSLETGNMTVENIAIGESVSPPSIAPPSNILATPGNGQAGISWDPVPGATSYNVYYSTTTGVTRGSVYKVIGTNANTSQAVNGLTNGTTYYLVVTAVGAGVESFESAQVIAKPLSTATSFSQTDLTGNWYFIRFAAGSSTGWRRGTATIAANGAVTVNSILNSSGNTTTPPAGTIAWTVNSRGVVTQSGTNALDPGNHGVMAANKQIIVGTGSSGGSRAIYVCVKQGVTTFANSDLTSKSFAIHALESGLSGPSNKWLYGNGHTDGSNRLTIDHLYEAPNKEDLPPPPNFSTLSVNSSSGIVSFSQNTFNIEGIMTPDKKNMFMTFTGIDETFGTHYAFMVIQMTGQSYQQSDMAGTWRSNTLISSASSPEWEHSTVSIANTGVLTALEYLDSTGDNDPAGDSATVLLSSSGIMTVTQNTSLHGMVSFNKNMTVFTETPETGIYSLTIILKQ
jgi:hypothetical protein